MRTFYLNYLKLVLLSCFSIVFNQAFASDCPDEVQLGFGKFDINKELSDVDSYSSDYIKPMIKFINEKLQNSTYIMKRDSQRRTGLNNKCIYKPFKSENFEFHVHKRLDKIIFTFIRDAQIGELTKNLYVFDNRIFIQLETTNNLFFKSSDANVVFNFSYEYSCGFADCASKAKNSFKLGDFSELYISK